MPIMEKYLSSMIMLIVLDDVDYVDQMCALLPSIVARNKKREMLWQ